MKTWRISLVLVLVGAFEFFAIIPGNAQAPKRGGTLTIGTEKDPQGLDPHKDVAKEGINVLPQIYDGLLNINDEGNVIPGLCESMPSQPDPVTYVFALRKGVKFHNGADFDAQDVKFSFDRLMNKDISMYWKTYQGLIKTVEILDPYKVKVTLNAPNITFLDMLAKFPETHIVPRGSGSDITQPIGTGPFKFKEWIKDDRLTFVRNEAYWEKGLPYLDQIIYKPFPEPTTRVINLKTSKVDIIHVVPITDAAELKKNAQMKVLGRTGGEMQQLYFNTAKPPFDNKKVRQAVSYGIDRQTICNSVFMGFAEVAQDLFPSWHWAHSSNVKAYPYNPDKAKALLKEAGYSPEKPLSFSILCENAPRFTDQLVIMQAQLAKIGVKVEILPVEKSYRIDAEWGRKGRDYEAMIAGIGDEMTETQWAYRFFHSKSFYDNNGYNNERLGKKGTQNPEVDRLLSEIVKIADRSRRRKMWEDVEKMIIDDAPVLRLSYADNLIGMIDHVKNHKILTRNNVTLKEVWIDK